MIQAIGSEQVFVSNLEQFISKADKFIKTYYSGVSDENHIQEIVQELKNLVLDTDLKQLEIDYQYHCEIKDLMGDYDDSAWF
ncbi:MAG: Pb-reticulocyte-binding protein [Richelia sp. RM2_1_2]|nr:Pb-reticulocyte-binding protein [Richelia sp. SM1_7_0]NJN13021.1 Pb-reticulocyte-binding protein [Richelia sp. RM1_1_1]NJO31248.1 Pb-reticulocyte-binding protein [Richelia sp. SL_2_1]NJO64118.1 Pb-reticulocyte-binding protein [Richelia sp. RM2_1_2]